MPAKALPRHFQEIAEIANLMSKKWFDKEDLDEKCGNLIELLLNKNNADDPLIITLFDDIIELLHILKDKKFIDNGSYLISEISEIFYTLSKEVFFNSPKSAQIICDLEKIEAEYITEALLTGEIT